VAPQPLVDPPLSVDPGPIDAGVPPLMPGLGPYGSSDGGPTYPLAELIASAVALAVTGAGLVRFAAPALETSAFDLRVHPDTSCKAMERGILAGQTGSVGMTGGTLGTVTEVAANPVPGGGAAPAQPGNATQNATDQQTQQAQVADLRRRWAQNEHDKQQAQ